jgi:hypothetical protein
LAHRRSLLAPDVGLVSAILLWAMEHDYIDASTGCIFSKTGGMTATVRFHHLHVVVLRKAFVDRDGIAGRY